MTTKVPLYKIPEALEDAEILDASILPKYNESLKLLSPKAQETLGKFQDIEGQLAHSSPLMLIHLANSGALPKGSRLATRYDLQTAIANDESQSFLRGRYTDFGLALRTAGDTHKPNDALAKKLAKQLKHRGIELNQGVLIPLDALKDQDSQDEPYGLTLDLNDLAIKGTIRYLDEFTWNWKRDQGLACAYLDDVRGWYSNYEHLDRADGDGRVVVVRAAGTRADLEQRISDYKTQMEEARKDYLNRLQDLQTKIGKEIEQ